MASTRLNAFLRCPFLYYQLATGGNILSDSL
jgi:hypothetical protein